MTAFTLTGLVLILDLTQGVKLFPTRTDHFTVNEGRCNLPHELIEEISSYKSTVQHIINAVVRGPYSGEVWTELARFIDKFGSRLAGTSNLEDSIDYMVEHSQKFHLDNVHTEPVTVPHWIRGNESATLLTPRVKPLTMLGLGGSVGTREPDGITAEVIVVEDFNELRERAAEVPGKIVVFAVKYESYHRTKQYRRKGASKAAELGAVATLVRSLTPFSLNTPHTGWQNYVKGVRKIPTASITAEDANMLLRMDRRGEHIVINLKMGAKMLQPKTSRNTMAEVSGYDHPNLYVIVSGHLDSWDVGDGALDDGGGALVSLYTPVLLKKLGLTPKRTVRAVLWTGEEEGLYGAHAYKKTHPDEEIVLAMESDEGTFSPTGMTMKGTYEATCIVKEILKLLAPINATELKRARSVGSDITVWRDSEVPTAHLSADDGRYFWFHHTSADTMEVQDPAFLDRCLAVMASVSYVVADLSIRLPYGPYQQSNGWSDYPGRNDAPWSIGAPGSVGPGWIN